jgi:hypothetical protein
LSVYDPEEEVAVDQLRAARIGDRRAIRDREEHPLMFGSAIGSEIRMMPDPWANMLAHLPPGSTLTLTIQTPEAKP